MYYQDPIRGGADRSIENEDGLESVVDAIIAVTTGVCEDGEDGSEYAEDDANSLVDDHASSAEDVKVIDMSADTHKSRADFECNDVKRIVQTAAE